MTVQKYQAFIRTVELGSLTKAAIDLGYTQSGISHMIQALEEELGATLLLRDRSGVKITTEGTQLLPYIRNICNSHRDLMDSANQLHGLGSGIVRIGTFSSVSCHLLPKLMKEFQDLYPNIEFELLQGDYTEIENWVNVGYVDFGFLRLPSISGLESIPIMQDRYMVILPESHTLAKDDLFPVEKMGYDPFILLGIGEDNIISLVLGKNKFDLNVRYHVVDDYTIMSMVENGLGIGILPELVLNRNPYHIVMKELSTHPYRTIGIVLKDKSKASAAVKCFINYVSDAFNINK